MYSFSTSHHVLLCCLCRMGELKMWALQVISDNRVYFLSCCFIFVVLSLLGYIKNSNCSHPHVVISVPRHPAILVGLSKDFANNCFCVTVPCCWQKGNLTVQLVVFSWTATLLVQGCKSFQGKAGAREGRSGDGVCKNCNIMRTWMNEKWKQTQRWKADFCLSVSVGERQHQEGSQTGA